MMQAGPNALSHYYPFLFLLTLFVAFLCLMFFLSSFIGGWHKLSERFCAQSEPYGHTRSAGPLLYAVYMRCWQQYHNAIRLTAAGDALYLSVTFPIHIGHPPLRIPWNEIQIGRERFLWRRYVVLTLGKRERIPMRISERMAGKLGLPERMPRQA
jgi:hypothetical protein